MDSELLEPEIHTPLETLRHSCAHVMAHAIKKLWPKAQFGIGPTVENGFYYDVLTETPITPEDLTRIEKEMERLIRADSPFVRKEHTPGEAIQLFRDLGQPFKIEIIETLRDQMDAQSVSTYTEGDFVDLCRGPHIARTKEIGAFKVQSIAGAYWRGNEKNPQLQRIYGTAFPTAAELKEHLELLEQAKLRDHRKLGRELDLFSLHPEAPGSPFFHAKGTILYNRLVTHMRHLYTQKYGYQEVITPEVLDVSLWKKSGHYDHYRQNMYFTEVDERQFAVKPMNCPCHTFIFASQKRSYRELPMRIADFGRLHRYERSGTLQGITRVRSFCQDDAHIFCSADQVEAELASVIEMMTRTYRLFGFMDFSIFLSTRPPSRVGADTLWDQTESALHRVLKASGQNYKVNPGDGAFYGPKIDFLVRDALKRDWQLGTIQLDFNLPELFDLSFVGSDNTLHRPVMIHRAVLGSLERFLGVYIEHVAGAFPFWLAPVQARLIPITDAHVASCKEFEAVLRAKGYRVDVDARNEKMGLKTREAQMAKIPFSLVLGDREMAEGKFAVRKYGEKESAVLTRDEILARFAELERVPFEA